MEEIALISAAIGLAEKLYPRIAEAVRSGEVSVEEQAALAARIESLRTRSAGQFSGPEWTPSTPTIVRPPVIPPQAPEPNPPSIQGGN